MADFRVLAGKANLDGHRTPRQRAAALPVVAPGDADADASVHPGHVGPRPEVNGDGRRVVSFHINRHVGQPRVSSGLDVGTGHQNDSHDLQEVFQTAFAHGPLRAASCGWRRFWSLPTVSEMRAGRFPGTLRVIAYSFEKKGLVG